jgi:hypothetical protein
MTSSSECRVRAGLVSSITTPTTSAALRHGASGAAMHITTVAATVRDGAASGTPSVTAMWDR